MRPSDAFMSGGRSVRQVDVAAGQRVWKRQPEGGFIGLGALPRQARLTPTPTAEQGRMESPLAIHQPCQSALTFDVERIHVIRRMRAAFPPDHDPL
jgi:hypothetical protein